MNTVVPFPTEQNCASISEHLSHHTSSLWEWILIHRGMQDRDHLPYKTLLVPCTDEWNGLLRNRSLRVSSLMMVVGSWFTNILWWRGCHRSCWHDCREKNFSLISLWFSQALNWPKCSFFFCLEGTRSQKKGFDEEWRGKCQKSPWKLGHRFQS